jgi:demethylspheroidene O-methyltransferase
VRAFGGGAKSGVATRGFGSGEGGDGVFACGRIGEQVEGFALAPSVAGNDIGAVKRDEITQICAAIGEDGFEDVALGENRGTGVDAVFLSRLAAGAGRGFADGDVMSFSGEQRSRSEAANPGTDNQGACLRHFKRLRVAVSQYVQQIGHMQLSTKEDYQVRWLRWRNNLLANSVFRRWAGRLPIFRTITRQRAGAMFSINAGFIYSQVALAMVETGLIGKLAAGPLSIADAARHADLPEAGAERLLKAAAALDLAQRLRTGDFMLGQLGAALHGDPGISAMIDHHRHLYADLADPVGLLRRGGGGGALSRYWAYAESDDPAASGGAAVAPYSALMASSQRMVADQVTAVYNFSKHKRLLDVGGGEGVFVRAAKASAPGLEIALFDLPAVAARAGDIIAHGGNFFEDPLPQGFDLISLVRILHDHDDEPAMILLRNIRRSMPSGGRLMIAEPMAGTRGAEAMGDAYFGMYLWAMGSGRPRTVHEIKAMLEAAGFASAREISTDLPMIARVLITQEI